MSKGNIGKVKRKEGRGNRKRNGWKSKEGRWKGQKLGEGQERKMGGIGKEKSK